MKETIRICVRVVFLSLNRCMIVYYSYIWG
nr:MAG TPA: hypothetical protein [Caudoviricetes sp.]